MSKQVVPQTLKEFRQDRGMSQVALGKKIGVSGNAISHYETGNLGPSLEVKLEFLRAFGNYNVPVMQLTDEGWQKIKDRWICPDCVTEVRGRNNDEN